MESTKVTESEPENPEAPPKEEVTELLSGETISKLSIGCLQNSLLPVELLEENIEELSDEDEIFEIKRTVPRPEQVEVEADQEKDKLLPSEEIADDHINDSIEEEKHSKHSNDMEEMEEDMEDSPAPLPECDQHDEIIDNQKDEDSNANDKFVIDKNDNENSESCCNTTIIERKQVSYPEDLNPDPVKNPFGSDNDKEEEEDVKDEVVEKQQQKEELDIKKESTNPFGSDDDDYEEEENDQGEVEPKKPEPEMKKESSNPFGSDSDSDDNVEEEDVKQKPVSLQAPPPKPPRLSLNPFGSDFEDDDEGNEVVPEGKKQKQVTIFDSF